MPGSDRWGGCLLCCLPKLARCGWWSWSVVTRRYHGGIFYLLFHNKSKSVLLFFFFYNFVPLYLLVKKGSIFLRISNVLKFEWLSLFCSCSNQGLILDYMLMNSWRLVKGSYLIAKVYHWLNRKKSLLELLQKQKHLDYLLFWSLILMVRYGPFLKIIISGSTIKKVPKRGTKVENHANPKWMC